MPVRVLRVVGAAKETTDGLCTGWMSEVPRTIPD